MLSSRQTLAILSLSLSIACFMGCAKSKKIEGTAAIRNSENSIDQKPEESPDTPSAEPSETIVVVDNLNEKLSSVSFGLLNFRQLLGTYQQLTGVSLDNQAVLAAYSAQLGSLPRESSPAQISASKIAGATKLAAQFCDVLSNDTALLSQKFPGLRLNSVPPDSAAFAKTLPDGFYGPEHALQGARSLDIAAVAATVDALKSLNGTGSSIFMASCTAILASAEFYLY